MKSSTSGFVLLNTLLLVVVVAGFAVALRYQESVDLVQEETSRAQRQMDVLMTGALDWQVLALTQFTSDQKNSASHYGEAWAKPLYQFKLTEFLSPDTTTVTNTPSGNEVLLSSRIVDVQGRLNVTNLLGIADGDTADLRSWQRLFLHLKVPQSELTQLVSQLNRAFSAMDSSGRMANGDAPLYPQTVQQLQALGLSATSVKVLEPFITVLPERTLLNLNTASAEVLMSSIDGLDLARALEIVKRKPAWQKIDEVQHILGPKVVLDENRHGVASKYFEIHCHIESEKISKKAGVLVWKEASESKILRRIYPTAWQL
jgi:general secretion pathway protein K